MNSAITATPSGAFPRGPCSEVWPRQPIELPRIPETPDYSIIDTFPDWAESLFLKDRGFFEEASTGRRPPHRPERVGGRRPAGDLHRPVL